MRPGPLPTFLLLLAACGGGGGGAAPPAPNEARLEVGSATVPAGATTVAVDVQLLGPIGSSALLQFDLAYDRARLRPAAGRPSLEPLQPVRTLDGDVAGEVFRVLCGDARNPAPTTLREGPMVRLYFDLLPPRSAGTLDLTLQNARLVDAAGARVALDPNPAVGRITVP